MGKSLKVAMRERNDSPAVAAAVCLWREEAGVIF